MTNELRDRILIGFIYDAGLRISEASSMQITEVDLQRKQVHVRQSKNKKDRYIVSARKPPIFEKFQIS